MKSLLNEEELNLLNLKQHAIADSYNRMATNRDPDYRNKQLEKCKEYLEKMTQIYETALKNL